MQANQPDSFSQNHSKVSRNHFQSLWMVSNQDFTLPDSPVSAEPTSSLRIIYIRVPTKLEYSQRPSRRLRSLANRDSVELLELVASTRWPFHRLLSGYGMSSWEGTSHSYNVTHSGPFLSVHSWTGSSLQNSGGERVRRDRLLARDQFLSHSLRTPSHQHPKKRWPRNEGE